MGSQITAEETADRMIASLRKHPDILTRAIETGHAFPASASPIEKILWHGINLLADLLGNVYVRPVWSTDGWRLPVGEPLHPFAPAPWDEPEWRSIYQIQFQVSFDRYLADFTIVNERGQTLAIECDGKDFHTAPEHVARDKARDRAIMRAGVPVLRFTGAEIYHDALGCAEEAIETLDAYSSAQARIEEARA